MENLQTPVTGSDTAILGAAVDSAYYKLKNLYGSSYFGSGGAKGVVRCSANCAVGGSKNNGFISGPDRVVVVNPSLPARFYARGSDLIGEGREWGEAAEWIPGTGWVPVQFIWRKELSERRAWVDEIDAPT